MIDGDPPSIVGRHRATPTQAGIDIVDPRQATNRKRRVLITGGSGFIGTNTVDAFLGDGWSVHILDRTALLRAFEEFDPELVIHLAARTDLDERTNLAGYAANVEGVSNVIEAIRAAGSVERTFFASSRLVVDLGYVPKHDRDYSASTMYGQSKVRGEELVRTAGSSLGTWVIVRPTGIWGPWFGVPYRDFFAAVRRGLYFHPGSIEVRKSYGYVENTVYQLQRLAAAPSSAVHGQTFWLADPPVQIREWARLIQESFGARSIRSIPIPLLRLGGAIGDVMENVGLRHAPLTSFRVNNMVTDMLYDTGPVDALVGPLPFTVEQGVHRTVAWILGREAKDPTPSVHR
jgi:nucleoside-diphosphate-sugar epimerase